MKYIFISCLCLLCIVTQAQPDIRTLTLEEAVDLALQNNKAIQIQSKRTEIAENNVYQGNSGLLPTVNLIGSGQYDRNQSDLTIRTFQPEPAPSQVQFDENGVVSTTAVAQVRADYVIFAGFSGKYRYELLQKAESIARLEQEALINHTVVQVSMLFGEIVKLQSRQELLNESIDIDKERLQKVKDRKSFGQANGLEVLRAKTDLNIDTNALEEILIAKNNLIKQLNTKLGLLPQTDLRLSMTYQSTGLLPTETIIGKVKQNNPNIKLIKEGKSINEQQVLLNKAAYMPRLSTFASYGYFYQENDLQQLAEIQNVGYSVGISLQYNLFNGSQTKRNLTNARINVEVAELQQQQAEEQLVSQALQDAGTLSSLQRKLRRQQQDLKTFEETFSRTQEFYYNGKATSLDLREVQTALLNAKIEINETKVSIIQTQIRLNTLMGSGL